MEDYKQQTQARIGRLVTQKKTLSSELKAVTRSKHEAVLGARQQYQKVVGELSDEFHEFRQLTTDKNNTANQKHREAVATLEEHKAELQKRVKAQRAEYKEQVACVTSTNEALELLCTVSNLESKKLVRELSSEQRKAAALGAKELLLVERVHNLANEKEVLTETLETIEHGGITLRKEMEGLRRDLAAKSTALDEVNVRFFNWQETDRKFRRATKDKINALRNKRDKLMKVPKSSQLLSSQNIFLS